MARRNVKSSELEVIATVVQGHTFTISNRYEPKKILGRGSFGVVCTAYDKVRAENIAIKRIRPFANDEWDARHTLREIRLMKLLGSHPNIISLHDLSVFEEKAELYMVMELMDCDLHRIIQSKQPLNDLHFKCFAKQILEGIKAMHSVGVFHRDLKPGNILVSKDCQLRITDFGLARFMDDATLAGQNGQNPMTEYVVTRWYRCPELLLNPTKPYTEAVDIWSVGCILGELLHRKPLFPGKSHANQIQLILEVRGYSGAEDLGFQLSAEASSFLDRRCQYPGVPLRQFIPEASREAIELLDGLMQLDPSKRPSAVGALSDDYLRDAQVLCDYSTVSLVRPDREFFEFEREKFSLEQLREMVYEEVRSPCGPYVPNRVGKAPAVEVEPPPTYRRDRKDDDDDEGKDDKDGPRSQARTQVTRAATQNTLHGDTDNKNGGGGGGGGGGGKNHSGGNQRNLNKDTRQDSSASLIHRTSSMPMDKADVIMGLLKNRSDLPGKKIQTPRTPSPRRMESITQKDRRQKRLFLIQTSQRQLVDHQTQSKTQHSETIVATHRSGPEDDDHDNRSSASHRSSCRTVSVSEESGSGPVAVKVVKTSLKLVDKTAADGSEDKDRPRGIFSKFQTRYNVFGGGKNVAQIVPTRDAVSVSSAKIFRSAPKKITSQLPVLPVRY